jgi:hypothetical protein
MTRFCRCLILQSANFMPWRRLPSIKRGIKANPKVPMKLRPDSAKASKNEPAIPYEGAMVLSVLVVIGGLFFGLPLLLNAVAPFAVVPTLLLAIPLFPTITGWLQGCMDSQLPSETRNRALVREYVYHTWRLGLELTLVLVTLPPIAAQLIGVISIIMLIAFGTVLVLAGAQSGFGLRIQGITQFTSHDIGVALLVVMGCFAASLTSWGLAAWLERVFDRNTERLAAVDRKVCHCLRRYL